MFNTGCELEVGRGLSTVHWDELAEGGTLCPALATDDSHHPGFDSDHAWTWLRAEAATVDAVLDALRSGSFYGSQGPVFEAVRRDGDAIEVACSPCRSVILVSGKTTGAAVHAGRLGYRHAGTITAQAGDLVTGARLTIPPAAAHARVELVDERGRRAWSNPFAV